MMKIMIWDTWTTAAIDSVMETGGRSMCMQASSTQVTWNKLKREKWRFPPEQRLRSRHTCVVPVRNADFSALSCVFSWRTLWDARDDTFPRAHRKRYIKKINYHLDKTPKIKYSYLLSFIPAPGAPVPRFVPVGGGAASQPASGALSRKHKWTNVIG